MSENKGKDKLKKLKNKKKHVISINPLEIIDQNSLKNNFKDKIKKIKSMHNLYHPSKCISKMK